MPGGREGREAGDAGGAGDLCRPERGAGHHRPVADRLLRVSGALGELNDSAADWGALIDYRLRRHTTLYCQ